MPVVGSEGYETFAVVELRAALPTFAAASGNVGGVARWVDRQQFRQYSQYVARSKVQEAL